MRITTNMSFNALFGESAVKRAEYQQTLQNISSEKKLNKPSDDPTGMSNTTRYRAELASYEQYMENMNEAQEYLLAVDNAMQEFNDILSRAREIAEQGATGSTTESTREVLAQEVEELIGQSLQTANTTVRGDYIFAGYNTNEPAYADIGRPSGPYSPLENTYDGEASVFNTNPEGTNQKDGGEYLVRIVTAGGIGTAEYQVSEDGGDTWGSVKTVQSTNEIYDDINGTDSYIRMSFTAGTFEVDDEFTVEMEPGLYMGDSGVIEFNANKNTKLQINITGQELLEDTGYFDILSELKNSLQNNNMPEVSEKLEELKELQISMKEYTTKAGQRLNKVESVQNNLTVMSENLQSSIAGIEEPDLYEAISLLAKQEYALQASTQMLGKVFPVSLMNYI